MRLVEQSCPPTIAGEQKGRARTLLMSPQVELHHGVQVLVGSDGVADAKLHSLYDAHSIGNLHRPRLLVDAHDVSHQVIAALQIAETLVDHAPNMQSALQQLLVARAESSPQFLQLRQRGSSA